MRLGPSAYKTKSISEANIQECVSAIVSKYMPPDFPPWQIKLIPLANENAYYMLIRIHHLILDEQKNLNVCDMMLLDRSKGMRSSSQHYSDDQKELMQTPLTSMIRKPRNTITIYEDITEILIDKWNDFVHKHDSLNHHDGLVKKPETLGDFLASVVMMLLNTHFDYKQIVGKVLLKSTDPQAHLRFWTGLMLKEYERRQLSFKLLNSVVMDALNPLKIGAELVKLLWWSIITWIFLSPWYVWREVHAIYHVVLLNRNVQPNSVVGFLINYVPIVAGSVQELFYYLGIILSGPRLFIEGTFQFDEQSSHCLQSATLCGRKVLSWSKEISCEELREKAHRNQQTYSEILLSTVSSCLMNSFNETNDHPPTHVRINFRSIPYRYLFGTSFKREGVIGMLMPIEAASVDQLVSIRRQIQLTRDEQVVAYLLSIIQMRFDFLTTVLPSIWLKVIINFLSKKFSISITEVLDLNHPEPADYYTHGNAEILDVLYFRTPQANTSTAITIQRFRNNIRMCVMCDSNLSGKHQHITSHFCEAFHEIPEVKNYSKF